ncbi:MAG: hypothetical protein WBP26_03055 [Candidatus Saccharimonadales bacterium]
MAVHVFESPNQSKMWVGPWHSVDNARTQALMPYFTLQLDKFDAFRVEQERLRLHTLLEDGHRINLVGAEDSMWGSLLVGALLTRTLRRRIRGDVFVVEACSVAKDNVHSPYRQALGALVYGATWGLDQDLRVEERTEAQDGGVLRELGISGAVTVDRLREVLTGEFGWLREGHILPGAEELINPQNLSE